MLLHEYTLHKCMGSVLGNIRTVMHSENDIDSLC